MFAKSQSAALIGLNACSITVEVDINKGIPQVIIVGLPDAAINEARERVKSAIKASKYEVPLARVVINMAPADIRKEGAYYDLSIALAILSSSCQIGNIPDDIWIIGELSLNGELRGINGVLAIVHSAKEQGIKNILIPVANANEASLIDGINIYAASTLQESINIILDNNNTRQDYIVPAKEFVPGDYAQTSHDIKYVKGQYQAKRALEIAAAGGHNLLMVGEPGSGKSMLAQCLPSIMPALTKDMALDVTKIYSVAGLLKQNNQSIIAHRPFRTPHHTISGAGLIGGGSSPRPGEISLAHHGVLFLDELAEFDKQTLDNLRQPIETGEVTISRVRFTVDYPSRFLLIAACNPTSGTRKRSNNLIISAPLWDRFGLITWVPPLNPNDLLDFDPDTQVSSEDIRRKVARTWDIQQTRLSTNTICNNNAQMTPKEIRAYCNLTSEATSLLEYAARELNLTGRTYDHVLRVARTIADLDMYDAIEDEHIAEAIQYRTSQESILEKANKNNQATTVPNTFNF